MVSAGNQTTLQGDAWQVRHTTPVPVPSVRRWVLHCAGLCLPEKVYWCDGSAREREVLRERGQLNEGFRVGMAAFLSQAKILVERPDEEVGDVKVSEELRPLFRGCMRGRTMYSSARGQTRGTQARPKCSCSRLAGPRAARRVRQ